MSVAIELWNSRARVTPHELFVDLANECTNLGVSACDVYGDFDQTADTSYLRRFEQEISSTFGKEDVIKLQFYCICIKSLCYTFHDAIICRLCFYRPG